MNLNLTGKTALVCGASRGLGYACAEALAKEGVSVLMVARREDVLQEAAERVMKVATHGAMVTYVAADITTEVGRVAVFSVQQDFDILVTNAGGPAPGDFRQWNKDTWMAAVDANMYTPIALIQTVIDGMAARGFGRIINITSGSVKAPIDVLGLSNGARSGLTGFVAGVARSDVAAKGVTINNLLPGLFDTDRLQSLTESAMQATGQSEEAIHTARKANIPVRRFGQAHEFGAMCAFLCSDLAGYITGQNILMDGGAYPGTF
ncbi:MULTISPECIES: SDR family oxidoreductase [Vitreoscilla]|uniref:SDR family oxidoreductase n=1 Tax=Vitreoscilla stercoraria TaxID=61 RepID=A0ABY4EEE6_VITST|nr:MULTISPECIES: SDR family oxidoreductase [Vitreoscilla]AUZ05524.1 glucose/ribitol dehydrogenase [Vitreoscilla sp. C1]UOO93063.1 SDR family oxidoreductase [Vitreoscilla stercoraria]